MTEKRCVFEHCPNPPTETITIGADIGGKSIDTTVPICTEHEQGLMDSACRGIGGIERAIETAPPLPGNTTPTL